jgi:hypothetical protein
MEENARDIIKCSPINELKREKMVSALCIDWTQTFGPIQTVIASNTVAGLDSVSSGERPLCTLERQEFLVIPPALGSTIPKRKEKTRPKYLQLLLNFLFSRKGVASST